MDTLRDTAFMADAGRQGLNIDTISGEQLASTVAAAYGSPKAVVDRTKAYLHRLPAAARQP